MMMAFSSFPFPCSIKRCARPIVITTPRSVPCAKHPITRKDVGSGHASETVLTFTTHDPIFYLRPNRNSGHIVMTSIFYEATRPTTKGHCIATGKHSIVDHGRERNCVIYMMFFFSMGWSLQGWFPGVVNDCILVYPSFELFFPFVAELILLDGLARERRRCFAYRAGI
jgi:hypothetical protein